MKATIINIGNSQGVIIPATLLRKLNLSPKSAIDLEIENGAIVIKPAPRQGWESAAQSMHEAEDDLPLLKDSETDFDKTEWTW